MKATSEQVAQLSDAAFHAKAEFDRSLIPGAPALDRGGRVRRGGRRKAAIVRSRDLADFRIDKAISDVGRRPFRV